MPDLARDLAWVVRHLPSIGSSWWSGRLSRAEREQVIVAVAQTNACRMCEHAHTRMALEAGVSDAEIAAIENMNERAFDRQTWLAIGYARERVTSGFPAVRPSDAPTALTAALGAEKLRDIDRVARVMTVANRVANTLNALPDRLRGRAIPGSRLFDELAINALFLPGAWVGTFIAAIRQRKSPLAVWRQARGSVEPEKRVA